MLNEKIKLRINMYKFILILSLVSLSFIFPAEKIYAENMGSMNNEKQNILLKSNYSKDIIQIVMYGNISELRKILNNQNYKYADLYEGKISINIKDMALYLSLIHNKIEMAHEIFKHGGKIDFFSFYKEDIDRLGKNVTIASLIKIEEEYASSMVDEDGNITEGDCATYNPASIIYNITPDGLEEILKNNKEWCSGELMCQKSTYKLLSDLKNKEKYRAAYRRACGR